jgi:hypothetical protein
MQNLNGYFAQRVSTAFDNHATHVVSSMYHLAAPSLRLLPSLLTTASN